MYDIDSSYISEDSNDDNIDSNDNNDSTILYLSVAASLSLSPRPPSLPSPAGWKAVSVSTLLLSLSQSLTPTSSHHTRRRIHLVLVVGVFQKLVFSDGLRQHGGYRLLSSQAEAV